MESWSFLIVNKVDGKKLGGVGGFIRFCDDVYKK